MRLLPAVFIALVLPFATPALADEHMPATITVTGEGRAEAAPDLATISLGVTTQGKTAGEAHKGGVSNQIAQHEVTEAALGRTQQVAGAAQQLTDAGFTESAKRADASSAFGILDRKSVV